MTGLRVSGSVDVGRSAAREGGHAGPSSPQWARRSTSLLLLCLVTAVALTSGCTKGAVSLPYKSTRSSAQAQGLADAQIAVAPVFADVEACEQAVLRGASLPELTALSTKARDSALAFSRSAHSKYLPQTSNALLVAATYYARSCIVWRAEIKAGEEAWRSSWGRGGTRVVDHMHTERFYVLWVEAALNLGKARTTLKDGPP